MRDSHRVRVLTALAATGALLTAGCGGGSSGGSTSSAPAKRLARATPTQPAHAVIRGVHAVIRGDNHTPTVSRAWHYTVTVTDAQGRMLSGTETTQYTFNGAVVGAEKPENRKFSGGVFRDTIEFPPASIGYPLSVQAVVHVSQGTATADWPVKVHH